MPAGSPMLESSETAMITRRARSAPARPLVHPRPLRSSPSLSCYLPRCRRDASPGAPVTHPGNPLKTHYFSVSPPFAFRPVTHHAPPARALLDPRRPAAQAPPLAHARAQESPLCELFLWPRERTCLKLWRNAADRSSRALAHNGRFAPAEGPRPCRAHRTGHASSAAQPHGRLVRLWRAIPLHPGGNA